MRLPLHIFIFAPPGSGLVVVSQPTTSQMFLRARPCRASTLPFVALFLFSSHCTIHIYQTNQVPLRPSKTTSHV